MKKERVAGAMLSFFILSADHSHENHSLPPVKHDLFKKELMENIATLSKKPASRLSMEALKKDGALIIRSAGKDLLAYQYETADVPAGVDTAYRRSGFIHPLYAPHGQALTRIQPPDHYHHYGIWNPWTHTLFENDTVDFWNIRSRKGTVRFARFNFIKSNDDRAEFEVRQEHVVFRSGESEKIALLETLNIAVSKPQSNDKYIVDYKSTLQCAGKSPLLIMAYRYGGFSWRATEYWNKENSAMLTSAGLSRDQSDGSKAKWCIVSGDLPSQDYGGILILSHPANYNHPEPLRTWDSKANEGNGDVFINFCPAKDKDWMISPGKEYTLRYRLVVFNGHMDATTAEKHWQEFSGSQAD